MDNIKPIEVWTDGSSLAMRNKPNTPGAWAFIIVQNGKILASRARFEKTNGPIGRMELTAAYRGLLYAYETFYGKDFVLYSDSQYIVKGLNEWMEGWKKRGWKKSNSQETIAHPDIWKKFYILTKYIDGTYNWVKGHNGSKFNEHVDKLANACLSTNLKELK